MSAPRKFAREQLQVAALALVDEEGLPGLTMRSLATALGTGPMTIYNYVDGRQGLEQLVTEAVMAQARWTSEPRDDWRDQVVAVAEGMWQAVRAHPHAVPLILTRRSLDLATLLPAEALLQAIALGGKSGAELLVAFRTLSGFITGFAQAELAGPLALARDEDATAATDRVAALPSEQFPRLTEIVHAAVTSNPETEFRAGLHIILKGLDA
ncbi:TetR/AcrR family transcriptional regulator [Kribbella sp. DT2]|uniref:TetR/AcrR family transcriptional regulator n=1 Tax=Kribbella sp. DT2 TaxID=3393427 RepID=UPI003CE8C949